MRFFFKNNNDLFKNKNESKCCELTTIKSNFIEDLMSFVPFRCWGFNHLRLNIDLSLYKVNREDEFRISAFYIISF